MFCGDAIAQKPSAMWLRRDRRITNQFTDIRSLNRGDLLVVLINERSDVQNRDRRLMDKTGSSSVDAEGSYGLTGGLGAAAGGGTLEEQTSTQRNFNGNTQFSSEREFLDRFAVTVVDVLPNGNLLIHGSRKVMIEGDQKTLILNGIVRDLDVAAGNTIASQNIANLNIRYVSTDRKGQESKFINQGWLGRKLNRWWPY